jgi:DNA-binding beta-propeller fold protein YncE
MHLFKVLVVNSQLVNHLRSVKRPLLAVIFICGFLCTWIISSALTQMTNIELDAANFKTVDTAAWSPPSPDPGGIDYHPQLGQLLISDGEVEEMSIFEGKNFYQASTSGVLTKTCDLTSFTNEPIGVAVNPSNGAVFIVDDNADRVYEVRSGLDGELCTSDDTRTSFNTQIFNAFDPEGLAYGQGMLFISDSEGSHVYVIAPGADGQFDGVSPTGDDQVVRSFDTTPLGISDPKGIGYHPLRGSLFLVSRLEQNSLFEVSVSGALLNVFSIAELHAVLPAGVGIGPSSQDASQQSVYITDIGVDNEIDPNERDGKLYEVSLDGAPPPAQAPHFLPAVISAGANN